MVTDVLEVLKKPRLYRITCLGLAVLAAVFLAGCAQRPDGAVPAGPDPADPAVSGQDSRQLSVMVLYDQLNTREQAADNALTQWQARRFLDETGISLSFVPIWTRETDTRLNVLLSSGTAPDLCFTFDQLMVRNSSTHGLIHDLTQPLAELGAPLANFLGRDILDYGTIDGRLFAIPSKRTFTGKYTTYIRKDWLYSLGLAVPDSYTAFSDFLYAVKTEDPGRKGAALIALGLSTDEMTYENMILPFIDRTHAYNYWAYDTLTAPGARDGLAYLNGLYHEGLINLDFAIDFDNERLIANLVTGNIAAVTLEVGQIYQPSVMDPIQAAAPSAEFLAIDPFRLDRWERSVKKQHVPVYHYLFAPHDTSKLAEVFTYLNWLSIQETQIMVQDRLATVPDKSRFEFALVSHGVDRGSQAENILEIARSNPRYLEEIMDSCSLSLAGALKQPPVRRTAKSRLQYRDLLRDKREEILIKCLMAPPDLFDVTYDVLYAEYMEMGGSKIATETIAAYQFIVPQ